MRRDNDGVGSATVAICFAGWLNVNIPFNGASARRHLVSSLAADAFVAGTFNVNATGGAPDCHDTGGKCLLGQLRELRPRIVRLRLDPMLTDEQIAERLSVSPVWRRVAARDAAMPLRRGPGAHVSLWAPLLGSKQLSVLREQHDLYRVLALLSAHEDRRGRTYSRVIWSRLENDWLAPHPPLRMLTTGVVWAPPDATMSDRHAVMDRDAAEIYLGRWRLLGTRSDELLNMSSIASLHSLTPERFVLSLLHWRGHKLRLFPPTQALSCCAARSRCYASTVCNHVRNVPTSDGARNVSGKYTHELRLAVGHAAALLRGGASWTPTNLAERSESGRLRNRYHGSLVGLTLTLPADAPVDVEAELLGRYQVSTRWVRGFRRS